MSRNKARVVGLLGLAAGALGCGSATLAGPDWVEQGDAGSTLGTAQVPIAPQAGILSLRSISGTLSGSSDGVNDREDCYFFSVTEASGFRIRPISSNFNAVLYLFNVTLNFEGLGLLANDNENSDSILPQILPAATDSTGVLLTTPGNYLLAVAGAGRVPVSRTGAIFNFASPTEISGPDGPGGLSPLLGWTGDGPTGDYTLTIDQGAFPTIPSPGSVALLAAVGAASLRRRRA